jgi:4-hydroxy-tetrahydrodipicolinate synthase
LIYLHAKEEIMNLTGTGVAIITPFKKDLSVDINSLGKVIDHIISGGVNYIVTLGTTGETPVLSKEEKKEIIQFTVNHVNGRVPIVVGVGGNDTASVVKDLKELPLENAVAILSAAPYYNKPSQEGLYQHYKMIAEHSPKPVILYNVPGRTGRNMEPATTLRLAREVGNIMGIKEAGNSIVQCMEILKERPEGFLVLSGDDDLIFPQMACGMDGVISVAANAYPKLFSEMIRLCQQQDFKSAKLINDKLMNVYRLMFAENNPAGVKAFLYEMYLIENELRLPLVLLSQKYHQEVKDYVASNK